MKHFTSPAIETFMAFWGEVVQTEHWKVMEQTVEASEWHREANVAVHTSMCIDHYITNVAPLRSERERALTLMTLLFHDFGKPEAEETLERKDGSGTTYHRYAGHEPKSANEFISFFMSHEDLAEKFFEQHFNWSDVRKIKWMIENHLPFGLKNPTKRENLKRAFLDVLGDDGQCFFDQLWSDCNGRISDDHETKRQNVLTWIEEFKAQKAAPQKFPAPSAPNMYVMVGPVGCGKSTYISQAFDGAEIEIISEDRYRMEYAEANFNEIDLAEWSRMDPKDQYAAAWKFCAMVDGKGYDKYAKEQLMAAVASKKTLVLDRTNQTRKSRSPWIQAAKQAGYRIISVEFFVSEGLSHARQKTRPDKDVPPNRAHQIYMAFEVPWEGVEVDGFYTVPTFDE